MDPTAESRQMGSEISYTHMCTHKHTHTRQSEGNTKQDNGIYLNRRRRAVGVFVLGHVKVGQGFK